MKKVWGPYPEGENFSMYLEKPGEVTTCAFAYVINGDFAAGSYNISFYLAGKLQGRGVLTSAQNG